MIRPYYNRGRKGLTYYGAYQAARQLTGLNPVQDVKTAARILYNKASRPAKSRVYKARKGAVRKSFPKKVKGQIRELKRLAESDMGTLIFRDKEANQLLAGINVQNSTTVIGSTFSAIEEVLAQLRYYNPSAPTTLVTADGATGTYQKEFHFKRQYAHIECVNNYQVPVYCTVYTCVPKEDTSITPTAAWAAGLVDCSNVDETDINIYPSDFEQFKDLWKIVKTTKKKLQPGASLSQSHSCKPFQYDPSLSDSHALNYQSRNRGFAFMVVVSGCIAHDTVASQVGLQQSGVDIVLDRTFEVQYSAGADIRYIYSTNALSTFTNVPVSSNKPVADNQTYSLA